MRRALLGLCLTVSACGARTPLREDGSGGGGESIPPGPCVADPNACLPRAPDCTRNDPKAVVQAVTSSFRFTKDDEALYFVSKDHLMRLPLASGSAVPIALPSNIDPLGPVVVHDGNLAFLAATGLFVIPTTGGAPKQLASDTNVTEITASPNNVDFFLLAAVGDQIVTGQTTLGSATHTIYRNPLSGGEPVPLLTNIDSEGIASDEAHGRVIVATFNSGLLAVDLKSGAETVLSNLTGLNQVAVHGNDIEFGGYQSGLRRWSPNQPVVTSFFGGIVAVTADDQRVYFDGLTPTDAMDCMSFTRGIIGSVSPHGGPPTPLAMSDAIFGGCGVSGQDTLAVDNDFVYFVQLCTNTSDERRIVRVPKKGI